MVWFLTSLGAKTGLEFNVAGEMFHIEKMAKKKTKCEKIELRESEAKKGSQQKLVCFQFSSI